MPVAFAAFWKAITDAPAEPMMMKSGFAAIIWVMYGTKSDSPTFHQALVR